MVTTRSLRLFLVLSLTCNIVFFLKALTCTSSQGRTRAFSSSSLFLHQQLTQAVNRSEPPIFSRQILFVGGVPRSGTTLARAMLDAHPDIHCGEETRVIPRMLGMRNRWDTSEKEHNRLVQAGLGGEILDHATRAFISEILLGHKMPSAEFLCNKDPLVLNYMTDVLRIFPKAKFVLMIRDGRAVAYSIVSRNVTISGVNNKDYLASASFWNKLMLRMTRDCRRFGKDRCLQVYYEKLVQDPRTWMEKILEFGGIPWHENVLHHHELIGKEVLLSKTELSTNQVKQPVNLDAIEKWKTKIPLETLRTIYRECDMLKELGYKPV